MTTATDKDWQKQFGIRFAERKVFFSTKLELNAPGIDASQAHVLRRAFDLLELDGILCTENVPLVYFKEVNQIEPTAVARLHRKFWNHGGAPILALISKEEGHVYSVLIRPAAQAHHGAIPGLVEILNRTSAAIREFLPAVESGEFFHHHKKSFNPKHRVDRDLLDNLQATRDTLLSSSMGSLDPRVLNALLCRLVFACYFFDGCEMAK